MPLESTIVKATQDVANQGARLIETTIKKAWSVLDAASEKKSPSELLARPAISSIQGKPNS